MNSSSIAGAFAVSSVGSAECLDPVETEMSFASRFRMTIGRKIYALIGLGFAGLLGIALLDSHGLGASLKQQKQIELQHLTALALGIVKEEHAAAQKGDIAVADAQKRALTRVAALRYGHDDYFWINDMQPRMVMHPMKPELSGTDLSVNKDPNGKTLFVDMVNVVKKDGRASFPTSGPSRTSTGHSRSCPTSPALRHGVGSSAPGSISTTSKHRRGLRPSVRCWSPDWCC
jgi:hypothetical protein